MMSQLKRFPSRPRLSVVLNWKQALLAINVITGKINAGLLNAFALVSVLVFLHKTTTNTEDRNGKEMSHEKCKNIKKNSSSECFFAIKHLNDIDKSGWDLKLPTKNFSKTTPMMM